MPFINRKKAIITAGLIAAVLFLYTITGFLGFPWYARHYLDQYVIDRLDRQLLIGDIRFNPYTLQAEMENAVFSEKDGDPIASLDSLVINVDLNELFNKTVVVSTLELDGARVNLIIRKDGRLNIDALVSDLSEQQNSTGKPLLDLAFDSSRISNGEVHVADRSRDEPVTSTIKDINLHLSGISTVRHKQGEYRINLKPDRGTEIKLQGNLSLIPLSSEGSFIIRDMAVDNISRWLAETLPVHRMRGTVNVGGDYRLAPGSNDRPVIAVNNVKGTVTGFSVADRYSDMGMAFDEISLNDFNYQGTDQTARLSGASLSGLVLENARVRIAGAEKVAVTGLRFDGTGNELSLSGAEATQVVVYPRGNADPLLESSSISLQALSYSPADNLLDFGKVTVEDARLLLATDSAGRYILPAIPSREVKYRDGADNQQAGDKGSPGPAIRLGNVNISNSSLAYLDPASPAEARELVELESVGISDASLSPGMLETSVQEASLSGAMVRIRRDGSGRLDLLEMLTPPAREGGTAGQGAGLSRDFMLDKLELKAFNIIMEDNSREPALQHRLQDLEMTATGISTAGDSRAEVSLYAAVNDGGFLSVEGWVNPADLRSGLQIALDDIDLAAFDAYLRPATRLGLESGSMSMVGTMDYTPDKGLSIGNAEAGFADIGITNTDTGKELFAVNRVDTTGIDLALQPLDIRVSEISLSGPYINMHIDEKQNLNLLEVFKPDNNPGQKTDSNAADESAMQIAIGRIGVKQGRMDFADLSLTPRFSTNIHELHGSVSGFSTGSERYTSLKLEGQVNEYGSAGITGELQPFDIRRQSDIHMEFRNIDTHSLSPYAARFAGRKIKSGSLSLDLDYRIESSKLKGNNAIVLESLVLGERVESPDALDLPLDMAIALLQDDNDRIDFNLPISGDLSNPQFEIEAVVQKALGNLVGGIVSAPFKFIGSLFGASGEDLRVISFEPGSADITPPEAEQLAVLTKALVERPALKFIVTGVYDAGRDREALARQAMLTAINKEAGRDLTPLNYSDPELQAALDSLAEDRMDESVLTTMRERFYNDREQLEDAGAASKDYYRDLFTKLVEQVRITESLLEELARERARAIIDGISENNPDVAGRVTTSGKIGSVEAENNLIDVTLEAGRTR